MEGENPTRRYKLFRPRQAAFGSFLSGTPTNKQSTSLFNNSTGEFYLAVRDLTIPLLNGSAAFISVQQGSIGSHSGVEQPIVASAAALPGQVFSSDTATSFNSAWLYGNGAWAHDYPIAILPPGWSLMVQCRIGAQAMAVGFIWEAIYPDELDFMW